MSIVNILMLFAVILLVFFGLIDLVFVIKRLIRRHRETRWNRITVNVTDFWKDKK